MKKIKYILKISLVLIFSVFLIKPLNVEASAETLGDLRKIYEDVLREKQANDNKTNAAKNEIKQKEQAIASARDDLTVAEGAEEEASLKIEESNQKIAENKKEAENVLVYMQQLQNKNAYVEYVTGSSSMTELVSRLEAVKQISSYIDITLEDLKQEVIKNEQLKLDLQAKQKELTGKITNYTTAVSKLHTDIEALDELADTLDERLEIAKKEYDENKAICQKKIGRTDDAVKLSSCYEIPYNGKWLNPLTSGVVTSPMGYRKDPITGKLYSFHSGIDIGAREGTPVYASAAGKVAGIISRSSCGGNKVYINVNVNGKNYTTYYLHLLSYNVKVGDIVTQNTIIGYVGGYSTSKAHGGYDGCTTGAHLHYGVQNGWYDSRYGIQSKNVIVPPGMRNVVGYRFTSRTDIYAG